MEKYTDICGICVLWKQIISAKILVTHYINQPMTYELEIRTSYGCYESRMQLSYSDAQAGLKEVKAGLEARRFSNRLKRLFKH